MKKEREWFRRHNKTSLHLPLVIMNILRVIMQEVDNTVCSSVGETESGEDCELCDRIRLTTQN